MNLAVIAAFTAAAVSLVNIIVTARLASGSQFRQWQREEARPLTVRILTLSAHTRFVWARAVHAHADWLRLSQDDERARELQERKREYLAEGWTELGKLNFEVSQLNLIAAHATREAAAALAKGHENVYVALSGHLSQEGLSDAVAVLNKLLVQQDTLIGKFRADLGVPPGRNWLRRIRRRTPARR